MALTGETARGVTERRGELDPSRTRRFRVRVRMRVLGLCGRRCGTADVPSAFSEECIDGLGGLRLEAARHATLVTRIGSPFPFEETIADYVPARSQCAFSAADPPKIFTPSEICGLSTRAKCNCSGAGRMSLRDIRSSNCIWSRRDGCLGEASLPIDRSHYSDRIYSIIPLASRRRIRAMSQSFQAPESGPRAGRANQPSTS